MGCRHTGCMCQVEQGQEFCGDYCRAHAGDATHADHRCECGHPACTMVG